MVSPTARTAVRLGLLRFAPPGQSFPGRRGADGISVLADVRGALANTPLRALILDEMAAILLADFAAVEALAGVAKAGIAWAAMLAERSGLPAAVVSLDGPRASGLQREVEGDIAGRRVVLVDNLIGLGGSLDHAASIVTAAGGVVIGGLTVLADPGARLAFPIRSLWTQRELIDAAFDVGRLDGTSHQRLTQQETRS
jgi:orotate phosphoribosyltransferase